jgi:hypothetical protein
VKDFGGLPKGNHVEIKFKLLEEIYQPGKGLTSSILSSFGKEFIVVFLMSTLGTCFALLSPFLINFILKFVEDKNSDTLYGFQLLGYLVAS